MNSFRFIAGRVSGRSRHLGRLLLWPAVLFGALALLAAPALAASPGQHAGSFGTSGTAASYPNTVLNATAVQGDGKVVAAGELDAAGGPDVFLERFNRNGTADGSFGTSGLGAGPSLPDATNSSSLARALAIQPDGKIVVVGTATTSDKSSRGGILVERFNSNGSLDKGFGTGGFVVSLGSANGDGYAVAVQPDGKIIATGTADAPGSNGTFPRTTILRLNANGSLDSGFGTGGVAIFDLGPYSYPYAVALQRDGRIVVAGSQSPGLQVVNALIARVTTVGKLDPSFNGSGAYANQYAVNAGTSAFYGLAIQPDGKIIAVGSAGSGNTGANAIAVRFDSAGHTDTSFGTSGVASKVSAVNYGGSASRLPGATGVTIAPNGDVVFAGTVANGVATDGAVWALHSNGSTDSAFGGNGATLITSSSSDQGTATGIAIAPDGSFVVPGNFSDGRSSTGNVTELTGFGAPAPGPVPGSPSLHAGLRGVSGSYRVGSLKAHPIRVTISCDVACRGQAVITVSAQVARQLRLRVRGRGPVTLAHSGGSTRGAGTSTITLRFSNGLLGAMSRLRNLRAALSVTVISASGARKTQRFNRSVTFHR